MVCQPAAEMAKLHSGAWCFRMLLSYICLSLVDWRKKKKKKKEIYLRAAVKFLIALMGTETQGTTSALLSSVCLTPMLIKNPVYCGFATLFPLLT